MITEQLTRLDMTPPATIRDEWQRLFRKPVPPHSAHLLRRQIAWRLQAKIAGDLPVTIIRQLSRAASAQAGSKAANAKAANHLAVGTRLIREWNGQHIEVIFAEKGFEYGGRYYRSLSQIARHITGAHWSGPRFFGISAKQQRANG